MEKGLESDTIAALVARLGLQDLAEFVLKFGGPFHLLAAQAAYMLEPFAGESRDLARDLGRILEDEDEINALIDRIRDTKEHQ